MERKPCRRCLLQDIDESQLMEAIQQRIAALPASQRASAVDIAAAFAGIKSAEGRVLTDDVHALNTFEEPDRVAIKTLAVTVSDGRAEIILPPCSVVALTIKL